VAARLNRQSGVEVVEVVDGSPAALAGLRPEDLIVELNGTPVETVDDIQRLMVGELIGISVRARVLRGGAEQELELVPAELAG
jgi:S1-C subfamily serine protease